MLPIMTFEQAAAAPNIAYVFDRKLALPYESLVTLLHKFALFNAIPGQVLVARYAGRVDPFEGVLFTSTHARAISRDLHLRRDMAWQARRGLGTSNWLTLRFCSCCLAQRFHSTVHQRTTVPTCPLHRLPVQERCPHCGQRIELRLCVHLIEHPHSCSHCGGNLCAPARRGAPMRRLAQKFCAPLARASIG